MTTARPARMTTEQWIARELATAPALTEQQKTAIRRILVPARLKRPA